MKAIILAIGNELTLGQTVDTNSAWLSRRLAEIGIPVAMHVTVADELEAVTAEIRRACLAADYVLITGGLGPTEDDLTRHALAAAMGGVNLQLREECLEQIKCFFGRRQRPMPSANTIQAMFPVGSEPIENTCGTAPGIRARIGSAEVFAMPGVPREMRVMYDRDVRPPLAARSAGQIILSRVLWCYGAGESEMGDLIRDLMERGRNPTVGTTAQQTVIGVRIAALGSSVEEATRLLNETDAEIRRRLGTMVFGTDEETLWHAVGRLLIDRRRTVATAESCTGGLIAKSLTDLPGSSVYFLNGFVTYSNQAKSQMLDVPADLIARDGAVSESVAECMAVNCRRLSGADYALSVTGIAGPGGGTPEKPVGLVYIGLADKDGCEVSRHLIGEIFTREEVRDRARKLALNRLRLRLL